MRLALGIALVFGRMLSFTPSPTQAANAERVQRVCDDIRARYGNGLTLGISGALDAYEAVPPPAGLVAVVDVRVFELFCK